MTWIEIQEGRETRVALNLRSVFVHFSSRGTIAYAVVTNRDVQNSELAPFN